MARETLQKPARVLIVDDHPLLREALCITIGAQPDLDVCGESSHEQEAFTLAKELAPDLMLIDISLEDGNGIELVKRIHQNLPPMKMLVISAYPESLYAERALRAGAMGFISKQEPKQSVLTAIREVLNGRRYVSDEITQRLIGQVVGTRQPDSPLGRLTDRELEVFRLIGNGLTSAAIADRIDISVHTVESYRSRLKTKLGLANGTALQREAVRWVIENESG